MNITDFNATVAKLSAAAAAYYNGEDEQMTDAEYDSLVAGLEIASAEDPSLVSAAYLALVEQIAAGQSEGGDVPHPEPMLSLGKVSESKVAYFLLDRPSRPVELPTEPTLGWLDLHHPDRAVKEKQVFGLFAAGENEREYEQPAADEFGSSGRKVNQHYRVTAFTPAVAVPKAALDKLRKAENVVRGVNDFLSAVDEANRA